MSEKRGYRFRMKSSVSLAESVYKKLYELLEGNNYSIGDLIPS